jgi:hypothetical protein
VYFAGDLPANATFLPDAQRAAPGGAIRKIRSGPAGRFRRALRASSVDRAALSV